MCGFFVTSRKLNTNELSLIHERLQTRGPDDVKIRVNEKGSYVFSRLACTGRQTSSMQPLDDAIYQKKDFFVFNGEIYNYRSLNNRFKFKKNDKFLCDTEILDGLFKKFGFHKSIEKLNGGYSIGYVDKKFDFCYLTKDIFGQKSLYFSSDGNSWYFGSDPYSVAFCSNREISIQTLKNYLLSNEDFGTRGLMTPNNSFFKNVYTVNAGDIVKLNKKGHRITNNKILVPQLIKSKKRSLQSLIVQFNKNLDKVVENYVDKNKDVCFEYSGGIDSTLVMLSSLKLKKKFCYYIKIAKGIDNVALRAVNKAKKLKLKYKIVKVSKNDYLKDTIDFIRYSGLPPRWGTAPSMMPLYKQMRKDKIKICITGAGADEFFYGYNNIDKILNFDFNHIKNKSAIEIIKRFSNSGWLDTKSNNLLEYKNKIQKLLNVYIRKNPNYKKNIYEVANLIRFLDLNVFMQEIAEPQADLSAIMNSIEIRSPFLDNKITEMALKEIDHEFLIDNNSKRINKIFLRNALKEKCKELKLSPNEFVEIKKEGTRNFAMQAFRNLKYNLFIKKIMGKLNIKKKDIKSDKMKFKVFFIIIFYMMFKLKMNNKEILRHLTK